MGPAGFVRSYFHCDTFRFLGIWPVILDLSLTTACTSRIGMPCSMLKAHTHGLISLVAGNPKFTPRRNGETEHKKSH